MRKLKPNPSHSSRFCTIRRAILAASALILAIAAAGCAYFPAAETPGASLPEETVAPTSNTGPASPVPTPTAPMEAPAMAEPVLAVSAAAPEMLAEAVRNSSEAQVKNESPEADFTLRPAVPSEGDADGSLWIYALAAPFPTVTDGLSFAELAEIWAGGAGGETAARELFLSEDTLAAFSALWGAPGGENIRIANSNELLELAWAEEGGLALIPFEQISPRWKVLQIDGLSPLDPGLETERYPLKVRFAWSPREGMNPSSILPPPELPATNRDPQKLTTLVLTGTTALARYTAAKMEENGIEYPLGDIAAWLKEAEITHISNEVSFYEDCPPALPARRESRFCSDPRYIELLAAAGADVIELTGNHNLDWGSEPYLYSLELYRERGFQTYGGGENLEKARQPLIIEHAGTRLAFLGCNIAGPQSAWATGQSPGAAPCDLDWMSAEVSRLRGEGILPVVTFQHYEVDDYQPMNLTRQHFRRMAEAGAVIVSGSQAHFPHGFAFSGDSFLHYGLGNLFFDQMYPGYRRAFIDRHVFYDGRYLGVELLTTLLEDYARPRPMSAEERQQMLSDYFAASGW